jgi:hypothetical protein
MLYLLASGLVNILALSGYIPDSQPNGFKITQYRDTFMLKFYLTILFGVLDFKVVLQLQVPIYIIFSLI